ncbi:bifunctional (p)ppGpp synthetase/guanosine-3',5'-bis(diphosphate) 3'-pyrophosphohydrolase, partial [Candidatus Kaiserbacteria bacterium]|nr:bifunctional (p)ppGpp synthetase/guanosine-3',5'-bis(diphosphate) 3'-pyrophosphohydrolase [Candidatus Kaiserbacteria bacterium]
KNDFFSNRIFVFTPEGDVIDKNDFFSNRIFVFTPEGDVIDLPVGASPIDFAYAVHSEIGDRTSGAKVNNKLVGLDTHLANGDIVEITTKSSSKPSRKWLEYAKTSLAQRRIRSAIGAEKPTTKKNS